MDLLFKTVLILLLILIILYNSDIKNKRELYENYANYTYTDNRKLTNYDKWKLFTKPFDQFCINEPPSCNKSDNNNQLNGYEVGCWCKNKKSVLTKENNYGIEYDPYIEFRG